MGMKPPRYLRPGDLLELEIPGLGHNGSESTAAVAVRVGLAGEIGR